MNRKFSKNGLILSSSYEEVTALHFDIFMKENWLKKKINK